ncbi:MAG: hypothetical protein QGF90_08395 [Gammaproteobacteria bacterium]|nr:hypothetical protein [Gammaproteobacteria bacterium]
MRSYAEMRSSLSLEIPEPHPAQPPDAEPVEQQAGRTEEGAGGDGDGRQHGAGVVMAAGDAASYGSVPTINNAATSLAVHVPVALQPLNIN